MNKRQKRNKAESQLDKSNVSYAEVEALKMNRNLKKERIAKELNNDQ